MGGVIICYDDPYTLVENNVYPLEMNPPKFQILCKRNGLPSNTEAPTNSMGCFLICSVAWPWFLVLPHKKIVPTGGLVQLSQLTLRGWRVASMPQADPSYSYYWFEAPGHQNDYQFVSKIFQRKVTMLYLCQSIWIILILTLIWWVSR